MAKTYTKASEIQTIIANWKLLGLQIGFIPTMGALHQGHLSLVSQAKKENDRVVVSLFVNPTQFNDAKDFDLYPRTMEKDIAMLTDAGVDVVFAPEASEIYPHGDFKLIDYKPGKLANHHEGASRPGHFEGVTAVVKRLLDIAQPNKLYMGQKDYQQWLIIEDMLKYYALPVQLVLSPIIRESNGLAMSSRNERLPATLRTEAAIIHCTLLWAAAEVEKNTLTPNRITKAAKELLSENGNFKVDYFDICSAKTLEPLPHVGEEPVLICTAVIVGGIRLIDNLLAGNKTC